MQLLKSLAAASLLVPTALFADPLAVSGDLQKFQSLLKRSESHQEALLAADTSFSVELNSPDHGVMKVSFTAIQSRNWEASFTDESSESDDGSSVILLQGWADLGTTIVPAAGSIYRTDGNAELHVSLLPPNASAPLEGIVQLDGADAGAAALVSSSPPALMGKSCTEEALPVLTDSTPATQPLMSEALTGIRAIDLATDADYEMYIRYGGSTNSYIASVVNAANVIYQRDLGLQFNIVKQRVRTSSSQPINSTNASTLLNQFTTSVNSEGGVPQADVVQLFSGKDLDGSSVGLAWVGVVCQSHNYSYGLQQSVGSTLDPLVLAHEIGHTLSASHDSTASIMSSSISSSNAAFSSTSKSQIANYLALRAWCLSTATTPSPTPTATPVPTGTATPAPTSTPAPTPTATPVPTGTPNPTTTAPSSKLSIFSSFSGRSGTGTFTARVSVSDSSLGSCAYQVGLASKSDLSDSVYYPAGNVTSSATYTALTQKRLADPQGKVYVFGRVGPCSNSSSILFSPKQSLSPTGSGATLSQNLASGSTWIKSLTQAAKLKKKAKKKLVKKKKRQPVRRPIRR